MSERHARQYRPKSADEIARNMSAIRSTENRVESMLRRALHRMGFRYRKYRQDLPGRPDIVFPTEKVAVFVDGDYWHCRILVEQGLPALESQLRTRNKAYWINKFQRRVARDREVTAAMQAQGWTVLRMWESDVKKSFESAVESVASAVRSRRNAVMRIR